MKQLIKKIQTLFKSKSREQEPRTNPFADKLTDREFEAIINYVRATLIAEQSISNDSEPLRDELKKNVKSVESVPKTEIPDGKETSVESVSPKEKNNPLSTIQALTRFLRLNYHFRYNLLTTETEFRPAGGEAVYRTVTTRELNGISLSAQEK